MLKFSLPPISLIAVGIKTAYEVHKNLKVGFFAQSTEQESVNKIHENGPELLREDKSPPAKSP